MKNILRDALAISNPHEYSFSKQFEKDYRSYRRLLSNRRAKLTGIIRHQTLTNLKLLLQDMTKLAGAQKTVAEHAFIERCRRYHANNLDGKLF
jgi:hypothetical protein